jgi:hypothetical protein
VRCAQRSSRDSIKPVLSVQGYLAADEHATVQGATSFEPAAQGSQTWIDSSQTQEQRVTGFRLEGGVRVIGSIIMDGKRDVTFADVQTENDRMSTSFELHSGQGLARHGVQCLGDARWQATLRTGDRNLRLDLCPMLKIVGKGPQGGCQSVIPNLGRTECADCFAELRSSLHSE